jgi:cysteine desulfurase
VAAALGAKPSEIVFTSGATESAAMAIRGVLGTAPAGRRRLVVTAVEHPCVLSLARALGREGTPLTVVPVDRRGLVDPDAFRAALGPDVALACAMRANNETGVVLPVRELALAARQVGAPFFCDAVQAAGKMPLDVRELGVELLAITAQKFGGPRGAGVLWIAPGLRLAPLVGGEQERGRRGGTENLPGVAGLAAALACAVRDRPALEEQLASLRDRLERGLLEAIPGSRVNGSGAPRLANTASMTFPGTDAEALLMALDLEGVCASAGAACHSGSTSPSGVLLAMGLTEAEARSTLRFSLGWSTTAEEIGEALRRIPPVIERVRKAIPG